MPNHGDIFDVKIEEQNSHGKRTVAIVVGTDVVDHEYIHVYSGQIILPSELGISGLAAKPAICGLISKYHSIWKPNPSTSTGKTGNSATVFTGESLMVQKSCHFYDIKVHVVLRLGMPI